jgi:hypothetical protein
MAARFTHFRVLQLLTDCLMIMHHYNPFLALYAQERRSAEDIWSANDRLAEVRMR